MSGGANESFDRTDTDERAGGSTPDESGGGGEARHLPRLLPVLELLTEEELVELNHRVVMRLRLIQEIRAHGSMVNFRIGQRVSFTTPGGEVVRGTLARHNRKSVTVVTETGHQWRVSPTLLQPG